jgi:hypothetical protein
MISAFYESPQHPLSLFAACCVFICYLATASNSRDYSASRVQIPLSFPPVQNCLSAFNSELTTPMLAVISHRLSLLFRGCQVTASESQSHFTTGGLPSISWTWRRAPWDSRPETLRWNPYVTSSVARRWACLSWIWLAFRQAYVSHI